MGNYYIHIEGIGPHHDVNFPGDANRLAENLVKDLKKYGHTVVIAQFETKENVEAL